MTATPDERRFARATERMQQVIMVLAGAGALMLLIWRGWTWSAGWLLGCLASTLNFRWLRRVTEAMGSAEGTPRKAVLFGLRYLLLGGGAYVILKYTAISLPAALAGLFVPAAAAIVEILIELVYARN
jgi:ATP synthase I chain